MFRRVAHVLLFAFAIDSIVQAAASADGNAPALDNRAQISGAVLSGSSGLLRLNVASGSGNQQLNAAVIEANAPLTDSVLASQSALLPAAQASEPHVSASAHVAFSSRAFAHASGLAQLNQTAGTANASANIFTLNIHP